MNVYCVILSQQPMNCDVIILRPFYMDLALFSNRMIEEYAMCVRDYCVNGLPILGHLYKNLCSEI